MKTFIAALLLSATANAMPLIKDGVWLDSLPKTLAKGNGFALLDPTEADFIAAGWVQATPEQMEARAQSQAQAAIEAEAARIAGKPDLLKEAENCFLSALAGWNADHPEQAITTEDGFLQIDTKIEASNLNDVQKLKFSAKLRNYWDLVLFHGGRFGDVQYHPEVAQ